MNFNLKTSAYILIFTSFIYLTYIYSYKIILIKDISKNYIKELNKDCYLYESKDDLANIIKYIATENYGKDEVINQNYFKIKQSSASESIIIVEGFPNTLPIYFTKKWINPIAIEFKKDRTHDCLLFIAIYKYRD